ncbi:MAG: ABC transporter ATP-binding protein [Myxococcales bacterium]|nr:ABC transporter ATP-binding protein [Myxococcales bacterium]
MITVRNLRKRYGSFDAVKDISFEVREGEVFGFLGPNGAGKTTTMKMITGLLLPSSGEILVGGIDCVRDPVAAKKLMGYIPDRPFLYEKLTAKEFLFFVAGLYELEGKAVASRVDELLEIFGLTSFAQEMIENFSHGMKQRLTMASALVHRPRLIVVDEPMVGLDPKGSLLIRRIFRALCEKEGVSIFLSTHTLSVAQEVCDRIGILYRGELVALGNLEELRLRAEAGEASLEEVFLRITEGSAEIQLHLPAELSDASEEKTSSTSWES